MIDTDEDGDLAQAKHAVRRLEQVNREVLGRVEELRGQVQAVTEALGRERGRRVEAEAVVSDLLTHLVDDLLTRTYRLPDHACAECVPGGEILVEGFRCAFHRAETIRAHLRQGETT